MHGIVEVYESALARGTAHRRPIDSAPLAAADRLIRDMHWYVDRLTNFRPTVRSLARHFGAWIQKHRGNLH